MCAGEAAANAGGVRRRRLSRQKSKNKWCDPSGKASQLSFLICPSRRSCSGRRRSAARPPTPQWACARMWQRPRSLRRKPRRRSPAGSMRRCRQWKLRSKSSATSRQVPSSCICCSRARHLRVPRQAVALHWTGHCGVSRSICDALTARPQVSFWAPAEEIHS